MKEIKFRGQILHGPRKGEWVYGYYVYCAREVTIDTPVMEHRIYTIGGSYFVVDPNTVGRYIGREDKNGKEIFENDAIVGATSFENYDDECEWTEKSPCVVSWDEECAGFYPFIMNNRWRCDLIDVQVLGYAPDLLTQ